MPEVEVVPEVVNYILLIVCIIVSCMAMYFSFQRYRLQRDTNNRIKKWSNMGFIAIFGIWGAQFVFQMLLSRLVSLRTIYNSAIFVANLLNTFGNGLFIILIHGRFRIIGRSLRPYSRYWDWAVWCLSGFMISTLTFLTISYFACFENYWHSKVSLSNKRSMEFFCDKFLSFPVFDIVNKVSGFYGTFLDLLFGTLIFYGLYKVEKVQKALQRHPHILKRSKVFYSVWAILFSISLTFSLLLFHPLAYSFEFSRIFANIAYLSITIQYLIAFQFIILVEDLLFLSITGNAPQRSSLLQIVRRPSTTRKEDVQDLSSVDIDASRASDANYDESGHPHPARGDFEDDDDDEIPSSIISKIPSIKNLAAYIKGDRRDSSKRRTVDSTVSQGKSGVSLRLGSLDSRKAESHKSSLNRNPGHDSLPRADGHHPVAGARPVSLRAESLRSVGSDQAGSPKSVSLRNFGPEQLDPVAGRIRSSSFRNLGPDRADSLRAGRMRSESFRKLAKERPVSARVEGNMNGSLLIPHLITKSKSSGEIQSDSNLLHGSPGAIHSSHLMKSSSLRDQ